MDAITAEECARIAAAYPEPAAALLPVLHRVQRVEGYLSADAYQALHSRVTEVKRMLAGFRG